MQKKMQDVSKNNWRGVSKLNPFCKNLSLCVIHFWTGEQGEILVIFFTDKKTQTALRMKV